MFLVLATGLKGVNTPSNGLTFPRYWCSFGLLHFVAEVTQSGLGTTTEYREKFLKKVWARSRCSEPCGDAHWRLLGLRHRCSPRVLQIPVGKEQLGEMHDAFVELQRVEWGNALRCENKIRREYDGHGLSGHAIVVFISANVGDEM